MSRLILVWSFMLTIGWGCASAPATTVDTVMLAPGIYDVSTGQALSDAQFEEAVLAANFVLVGESHDSVEDHALQAEVFRMFTKHKRAALGMEMFQRPYQHHLDAFIEGTIDESEMLERTEWQTRWGFDAAMYRPLWSHAKELGYAIVALNVHRELTKRVSAVGLDGLSDEERAQVVELDLSRDDYRSWLRDVFAGHGMKLDDQKFERFYQAQVLWDETMADSAVRFLSDHPAYDAVFMALGRGHVERRWGVPSRIERRSPGSKVLVIVRGDRSLVLKNAKTSQFADILVIP